MVSKETVGIILAGGLGTRLHPTTISTSKGLLPVYDKPLVYYSLAVLMQAGIREILIITNPHFVWAYRQLFSHAHQLGLDIKVEMQSEPGGIPEAFLIGEKFIGDRNVCLVLGDNLFYGDLKSKPLDSSDAWIYAYKVKNPSAYGVVSFDSNGTPVRIIEKPKEFVSSWAVTGLYFYPTNVVDIAKSLKPSARGELEITDVNQKYCDQGKLEVVYLPEESIWLDAGTHDALADATSLVQTIEKRTGYKVGCIEEIAYRNGWVDEAQLGVIVKHLQGSYGEYVRQLIT